MLGNKTELEIALENQRKLQEARTKKVKVTQPETDFQQRLLEISARLSKVSCQRRSIGNVSL